MALAKNKKQKNSFLLTLVLAALFLLSLYLLTSGFKLDLGSSAKYRGQYPRVTLAPTVTPYATTRPVLRTPVPRRNPGAPNIEYGIPPMPPGYNN